MTELSDYKRMVMEPYQNKLKGKISGQAERITELEEALKPFSEIVIYPLKGDEYAPRIDTRGITHENVNKARALLTTTEDKS